jgi:hypothetical protein
MSKVWLLGTCLLLALILSAYSQTWVRQEPDTGFHASLDGSFRYGNINGFLQIPKGGGPGTTSNERPKFHEIGINQAPIGDASLGLEWDNHAIYAGARFVRLSGKNTPSSTLISRGTTFPAGSLVSASTQLDWYRGGYKYRFFYGNEEGAYVSLYPSIGFGLLNFDYRLTSPGVLPADRNFSKGAPQLGLRLEWSPGGSFFISGEVTSSLPFSTLLLFSTNLTVGYQFWGSADRGARVFLGVGYEVIRYEDNQRVPNHINVAIGPELVIGFRLRF